MNREMALELASWIWKRAGLNQDEEWGGLAFECAVDSIQAFLNAE